MEIITSSSLSSSSLVTSPSTSSSFLSSSCLSSQKEQQQQQQKQQEENKIDILNILLLPSILLFLDYKQLLYLLQLNKSFYNKIKNEEVNLGYWYAMCVSLAGSNGLYLPKLIYNSRDYFFNEIWIARNKWNNQQQNDSFRIRVSSRFRPGKMSDNKFSLPLHQFLRVRANQTNQNKEPIFIGEKVPEHYQDALLGTLMKQPVQLKDSNQILDRSVAVTCVLRGGKDPFTGKKLTMDCLIPLPELEAEISEFRKRQLNVDISLSQQDVMGLVDEVDPRLLEAMIEAEQIKHASKRVHFDANYQEMYGIIPNQHIPNDNNNHQNNNNNHNQDNNDNNLNHLNNNNPEQLSQELGRFNRNNDNSNNSNERDNNENYNDNESNNNSNNNNNNLYDSTSRWKTAKSDTARIIDINKSTATITMNVPGAGVRPFHFNTVFPQNESQEIIYHRSARDVVVSAVNGMNGCILCYGQTGSGKTYTMFGPDGNAILNHLNSHYYSQKYNGDINTLLNENNIEQLELISNMKSPNGIVLRSCAEVLRAKKQFEVRGEISLEIKIQYVEIYNEIVTDLISPITNENNNGLNRVGIRRATGELIGATERYVNNLNDVIEILQLGNMRKHFAATAMNEHSSRSHTVLLLNLTQHNQLTQSIIKSSLYLVDLAGSERVKKSKAQGQQMREARAINSSLLVLGKVIKRLSRSDIHVPYYESQLTTLLKASFGGNSKTRVIVTCRSDDKHHGDETLQTLRFGESCSMISNTTRTIATSVETVLQCLDSSINEVNQQINSLKSRGKENLPSLKSLEIKLGELKSKRDGIVAMNK